MRSKKKLNLEKLYGKVASLFVKHKPSDLTYSDISRFTGVPRPTLYYYFGKSPTQLIQESAKFAMTGFTQLYSVENYKDYKSWDEYHKARLSRLFKFLNRYPWSPELYIRYRNSKSIFGDHIYDLEKKYFIGISKAWEYFNKTKADEHAVRLFTYMKIGILYGLSQEHDIWKLKNQDIYVKPMTQQLHLVLTGVLEQQFR
jgi:hypothetical protein